MVYEVKTPLLLESIDAARLVIAAAKNGSIAPAERRDILMGARALQTAVVHDITARKAEPIIRAQEAKLIEAQAMQQDTLPKPGEPDPNDPGWWKYS
jgi:hypothetical protein